MAPEGFIIVSKSGSSRMGGDGSSEVSAAMSRKKADRTLEILKKCSNGEWEAKSLGNVDFVKDDVEGQPDTT